MKVKVTLEFLGSNYCGWQYQPNVDTVEYRVKTALQRLYCVDNMVVRGVSRTDEGVHASCYVLHYVTDKYIDVGKIVLGANCFLPQDVSFRSAEYVDDSFDARKAQSKTYVYRMYVSRSRSPLLDVNHVQLYTQPDLVAMQQAGNLFVGEHDFRALQTLGSNLSGTVRTVNSLTVTQSCNEIEITINGNAFLYNMVRNIAGVLVKVGYGKMTLAQTQILLDQAIRPIPFKTMPPNGLTLLDVKY